MKPWTLIALNIRKCITLCNLFWNVWYFPSYVYWLYLRNDKEVPAAIGSIMPKQENVQGDKKKSSPHLSLPFEPGHLSRNPVADRPLCLSVHFQTSPWPGEGKGCDWQQYSGSASGTGDEVTFSWPTWRRGSWVKTDKQQQHPYRSNRKEEDGMDVG